MLEMSEGEGLEDAGERKNKDELRLQTLLKDREFPSFSPSPFTPRAK